MNPKILRKILSKKGKENVFEFLSQTLSGSELNTLLLEVFNERIKNLTPNDVLKNYRQNRFVQAVGIKDILRLRNFELHLLTHFQERGFEIYEASPLSPLGACSVMGTVNQKKVVSALRNTEVTADVTNVLALEIAKRKGENPEEQTVNLSAIHRHVRSQKFDFEGFTPHFKIASLVSGGRDMGNYDFEVAIIVKQANSYIDFLHDILPYSLRFKMTLLANENDARTEGLEKACKRILSNVTPVSASKLKIVPQSSNEYYRGLRFNISLVIANGQVFEIIDGGSVDWTQQLLQNKKERLIISGIGSEFLYRLLNK